MERAYFNSPSRRYTHTYTYTGESSLPFPSPRLPPFPSPPLPLPLRAIHPHRCHHHHHLVFLFRSRRGQAAPPPPTCILATSVDIRGFFFVFFCFACVHVLACVVTAVPSHFHLQLHVRSTILSITHAPENLLLLPLAGAHFAPSRWAQQQQQQPRLEPTLASVQCHMPGCVPHWQHHHWH